VLTAAAAHNSKKKERSEDGNSNGAKATQAVEEECEHTSSSVNAALMDGRICTRMRA
jgi:hypothetical protein